MKSSEITFEFLDFWCSPIPGQPGGPDHVCFRDPQGLPALDGDTVKGLLRDAVSDLESLKHLADGTTTSLFGSRNSPGSEQPGQLQFSPATLDSADASLALDRGVSHLFRVIQQTALIDGVARNRSLRSVEWAVPCTLKARVLGPNSAEWGTSLQEAVHFIRQVGAHRHRGYGRVQVRCSEPVALPESPSEQDLVGTTNPTDCTVWLRVDLLSRTLLGSSIRTLGHIETLDHIPGSALFGAAISLQSSFSPDLFQNIRLTPAYPIDSRGRIALPTPLCWNKVQSGTNTRILSRTDPDSTELEGKPSPMRGGFVHPDNVDVANPSVSQHSTRRLHSPKSSRDPERFDRASDGQFFALERLEAGQSFAFAIEGTRAGELANLFLRNSVRLGRRRNSGNGQVEFSRIPTPPRFPPSIPPPPDNPPTEIRLYAWSDVALYQNGLPTLDIRPELFGLPKECEWLPKNSAIRTRSYSVWNQFHGGCELERHVISRGSILSFKLPSGIVPAADLAAQLWTGIGAFCHEGLGRLLLNPAFLSNPGVLTQANPSSRKSSDASARPTPTTPWQRWLDSRPSPEAELKFRQDAEALAERLRSLLKQQRALGAQTPTTSQLRSLARLIEAQSDPSKLPSDIKDFCRPGDGNPQGARSIRIPWWNRDLTENGESTTLSKVLIDFAQHLPSSPSKKPVLVRALLELAAESARIVPA